MVGCIRLTGVFFNPRNYRLSSNGNKDKSFFLLAHFDKVFLLEFFYLYSKSDNHIRVLKVSAASTMLDWVIRAINQIHM